MALCLRTFTGAAPGETRQQPRVCSLRPLYDGTDVAERKKKRKFGKNDGVFALSRKFTLTPIQHAPSAAAGGPLLVEPAWDGHRVLATRVGEQVRLAAIDYRDWTQMFPSAARALAKLPSKSVAIDGVVCVLDERGTPSFGGLREKVALGVACTAAVLIAWDLMWLDDEDLRALPLAKRRERLAKLLEGAPPSLMLSQALDGQIERVLSAIGKLGIKSVCVRSLEATYDGHWHVHGQQVDWQRSLSPPPPLSNADKVLYPRDGICKRDIVGFYRDIAPVLVPHLMDRPVVCQRWPDGIDDFDWYQHRVPPKSPDYIRAAWVDGVRRIVIENADALLWMVNQAALTYHVFASRLSSLTEPDYAMIDLDPGDRTTWWEETLEVALAIRRLLELLELPSVVKTSGQRGLHILVPLAPGHTFEQAEAFGLGVAHMLMRLMPDKVTIENEKEKRLGRLLVDVKQFVAKTLVAPYSLRAADQAPVSTPIGWDEVGPSLVPKSFNLRTLRARLDKKGDLSAPLRAGTAQLDKALAQLTSRGR